MAASLGATSLAEVHHQGLDQVSKSLSQESNDFG